MKYRRAQFEITRMDKEMPDCSVFIAASVQVHLLVERDLLSSRTATQSPMSDLTIFHRSLALSSPCNVGKRKVKVEGAVQPDWYPIRRVLCGTDRCYCSTVSCRPSRRSPQTRHSPTLVTWQASNNAWFLTLITVYFLWLFCKGSLSWFLISYRLTTQTNFHKHSPFFCT